MPNESTKDCAVCFAEALAEELVEVNSLRQKRGITSHLLTRDVEKWKRVEKIASEAGETDGDSKNGELAATEARRVVGQARHMRMAGLAFSGGGIRSATFNLGVLQGLAQFNKVRTFDYLSTVSGGGYIGNWLETWILRSGQRQAELRDARQPTAGEHGIDVVEQELRPTRTARSKLVEQREFQDQKSHTEPPPIRFLREYSNYLTPQLGALGADTWTVIAIYLRNLMLNQAILILFLFAVLLIPYNAVWLTGWLTCLLPPGSVWPPFAVFLLLLVGLTVGARNVRWLTGAAERPPKRPKWLPPQRQSWIIGLIVVPFFLALWILTAWLWPQADAWSNARPLKWIEWGVGLMGVPLAIASMITALQEGKRSRINILWWLVESLMTGAVSGLLMLLAVREAFAPMSQWDGARWHELTLGMPLTLLVFLLTAALQIGLMGREFCDPYREWWSRVTGWVLILTIVWAAGFGIAIYAPLGLMCLKSWMQTAGLLTWIGSTVVGVMGGNSQNTGNLEDGSLKVKLLSFAPYIFIVGLFSMLALALELILARCYLTQDGMQKCWDAFFADSPALQNAANWMFTVNGTAAPGGLNITGTATSPAASPSFIPPGLLGAHFCMLEVVTTPWLLMACVAAIALCLWLSFRVDLNEFSMNLMYRNRLTRCYLGATHERRMANPFSGLDCCDDLFLSTLRSQEGYSGPLPILNTTLNLVNTRELAWQERKAESFPMTPMRCGFDTWIEQTNLEKNYELEGRAATISKYAYRPTEKYGYEDKGFYVGTAMSISGAAASPNMGYHSVPSLALLMTFFNVRLGFWAGNPRNKATWTKPGPSVGLGQLLCELFGLTNDNARYVYLSDGGHFENLGIYELVKRRCKYILACDAGADPLYTMEDLGNAIRKCREDVGVEIEIDTSPLMPHKAHGGDKNSGRTLSAQHCVVGTIRYDMADPEGEKGVLVYMKASLTGDEPADVLNYQTAHPTFPHESTADQWFTESQFESYRRLGQHIVETLFEGKEGTTHFQNLNDQVDLDAFRALPTNRLFEEIAEKWPKKQAKAPGKHKDKQG